MNNKKILPLFIFIFIVVSIITGGLVYFAYNISNFTTYSQDTTMANVYIGGKNYNQSFTTVNSEIVDWKKDSDITIQYQDFSTELDTALFTFNVASSLDDIQNGQHNKLDVVLKENWFDVFLTKLSNNSSNELSSLLKASIDEASLRETVVSYASNLKKQQTINIGEYINDYNTLEITLNSKELNLSDAEVKQIMLTLNEYDKTTVEIGANEQFSLLNHFTIVPEGEPDDEELESFSILDDESLSIVGTGIYSVIVKTNFINIDKQISKKIPYYSGKGYEANVSFAKNDDLTFYNPNPYPFYLNISEDSNKLIFTLSGPEFINAITVIPEVKIIPPKTIIHEVTTLEPNRKRSIPGYEGYSILLKRIVTSNNDEQFDQRVIEILTEDIYMPKETIIEVGIDPS